MCGICGFVSVSDKSFIDKTRLSIMNDIMEHRGPDAYGTYFDCPIGENKFRVGLGHRRLSIIDLSMQGRQPMSNEDGTIWIVYNGEVYNFNELKEFLIGKGHHFKSHSDTEVIIHLYEEKGRECVNYLRGMFAFAIWDSKKKILFAARDRLGVKPFYYCFDNDQFVFASEVKAILKSGTVKPQVNRGVIDAYFTLGYVLAPKTMFAGIHKLLPGHTLTCMNGNITINQYWDFNRIKNGEDKGEKFYIHSFLELLDECVKMRLVSDVPLGVFLSGGIDSSTVVGIMSKLAGEGRVKTFCVGYRDKQASELEYARIVAAKFKTDHHEYCLEPTDFYSFLPKLVWHFDEPVVESAAIPLYFISKLAREHVTVLLSGEGADELFGGYAIYNKMQMMESYRKLPFLLRKRLLDNMIGSFITSEKKRKKFIEWLDSPLEQRYLGVPAEQTSDFREQLFSPNFLREMRDVGLRREYLGAYYSRVSDNDALTKMLYVDTKVWLPDDLLVKADKMSMATSVELRVPFLDYKMVEFAMSLPTRYKIMHWTQKYILKQSVRDLLPKEIIYRRKKGFPVPINAWFKGDFHDKAAGLLLDIRSRARGYFNCDYVEKVIKMHKTGKDDYSRVLFSLIIFEMWHRVFIDGDTPNNFQVH